MSGILLTASMGSSQRSTLTTGTDGASEFGYSTFVSLYGSLSAPTAFRGNTISGVTWNRSAGSGHVRLYMSGTSKTNSDATFASIQVNGLGTLTRASAGYTANDGNGNTLWTWSVNTASYPANPTAVPFDIA